MVKVKKGLCQDDFCAHIAVAASNGGIVCESSMWGPAAEPAAVNILHHGIDLPRDLCSVVRLAATVADVGTSRMTMISSPTRAMSSAVPSCRVPLQNMHLSGIIPHPLQRYRAKSSGSIFDRRTWLPVCPVTANPYCFESIFITVSPDTGLSPGTLGHLERRHNYFYVSSG